jgi:hypothetical protein
MIHIGLIFNYTPHWLCSNIISSWATARLYFFGKSVLHISISVLHKITTPFQEMNFLPYDALQNITCNTKHRGMPTVNCLNVCMSHWRTTARPEFIMTSHYQYWCYILAKVQNKYCSEFWNFMTITDNASNTMGKWLKCRHVSV